MNNKTRTFDDLMVSTTEVAETAKSDTSDSIFGIFCRTGDDDIAYAVVMIKKNVTSDASLVGKVQNCNCPVSQMLLVHLEPLLRALAKAFATLTIYFVPIVLVLAG